MMAQTIGPGGADREPIDDYLIDQTVGAATRPVAHRVLAVVNGILLIILAAVSFGLFWIVATMLGVV